MSVDSISSYLAISKNEQSAIATFAKSDPATKQGVATITKQAASLTTPAALLADRKSLGVVLQAFNLQADINQTAVLKALMTQDPTASNSLAVTSGNNNFKAFASFMASVSTVSVGTGAAGNLAVSATGAAASTITVQNTAYGSASSQTASNVGKQWSFVLDDGTAAASVQSALAAAAGSGASYTINKDGSVTVSVGAPPVTATKDSVGDAIYTLALAADASGNAIKQFSVISVAVPAGTTSSDQTTQVQALVKSIGSLGFGAAQNPDGSIAITGNSIDASASSSSAINTTLPGATTVVTSASAAGTSTLAFGVAGIGLQAGQSVTDGSNVLGTIQSVDAEGNLTLTAPTTIAVAKGDFLSVAPLVQSTVASAADAASASNIGFAATATGHSASGGTTIALGAAASALQPGQVVKDGTATIGTIASVDGNGLVTLTGASLAAVNAGDVLTVGAATTGTTTPALQNAGRVAAVVSEYQTNQYEQAQDLANPGMHEALYFTRSIANVKSISALMSDPSLLAVVTTNLGLPTAFGSLDFDQQVRLLTKEVDISKFQDPNYVKRSAEQYLAYEQVNQTAAAPTGTLALFGNAADPGQEMLAILGGQTLTTSSSSSGNSTLALFA